MFVCLCVCVSLLLMHGHSFEWIWTKLGMLHCYTLWMVMVVMSTAPAHRLMLVLELLIPSNCHCTSMAEPGQ